MWIFSGFLPSLLQRKMVEDEEYVVEVTPKSFPVNKVCDLRIGDCLFPRQLRQVQRSHQELGTAPFFLRSYPGLPALS